MSSEFALSLNQVSKAYEVYSDPRDRVRQALRPRLGRLVRPFGISLPERNYFDTYWALKELTFDVRRGETVGVIGQNGSGKSTLLKLVCGTLAPTTGEIATAGRIGALLELGSGFNPEYTGRENVMLNASLLGLTQEQTLERLDDILSFADIGEFVSQPVKTYSSGMAMRLAFAVIAHIDADILVIDEALAVGDIYFQQKCMRWLRQFRENGTVLFCGHDTGAVLNLCQRAVWLDRGSMRAMGDAKEVAEAYSAFIHTKAAGLPDEVVRNRRPGQPKLRVANEAAPVEVSKPVRKILPAPPPPDKPVVFDWLAESDSFGTRDAEIIEAKLEDADGNPLTWIQGGETVAVSITACANKDIDDLIAGFHIKDRLGQAIVGTNTITEAFSTPNVISGQTVTVRFAFVLPLLATGRYTITTALASGTLDAHVQLHWVHDSIVFDVLSPYGNGVLITVPMTLVDAAVNGVEASSNP